MDPVSSEDNRIVPLPALPRQRANIETHLMPDGSALLYDAAADYVHVLNVTGSFIWEYCDGTLTPEQIAAELVDVLPQTPEIRDEALRLIVELHALGLFAPENEMPAVSKDAGLSVESSE